MFWAIASPWSAALRYQVDRLRVVLRHAAAAFVDMPTLVCGRRVALLRRLAIQRQRLGVVLRHALAVGVQSPRLFCASTSPWSAALRYHVSGLGIVLRDPPRPLA